MVTRLRGLAACSLLVLAGASFLAQAQRPAGDGIYTCLDDKGRRITSDRPIPECSARDQQLLNRDGSLKRTVPPVQTAEERAEQELRERKAAEARAAQADAMRQDRLLVQRYRNPEEHRKGREASLDAVRAALAATNERLAGLGRERKQYTDEAEFYRGRQIPQKLQQQIDSVDVAMAAQRNAAQNQRSELDRVNRLYDIELERLKRLWAGAAPGSLGPIGGERAALAAAAPRASQPAAAAAPVPRKP